jgi:hypothetical protein
VRREAGIPTLFFYANASFSQKISPEPINIFSHLVAFLFAFSLLYHKIAKNANNISKKAEKSTTTYDKL